MLVIDKALIIHTQGYILYRLHVSYGVVYDANVILGSKERTESGQLGVLSLSM